MPQPDRQTGTSTPVGGAPSRRLSTILAAPLLAIVLLAMGTLIFLSKDLPNKPGDTLQFEATDFSFAFGSGQQEGALLSINEFANGYALLSSGEVRINAGQHRFLAYTWLPSGVPREAAFFWRRAGDSQNVIRTDLTTPGAQFIDLSNEPDWQGEITEFGFLLAGNKGEPISIGETRLLPDSLGMRMQSTWNAWLTFEVWGQQSINFLYGGDYRQPVALPLLLLCWLLTTLIFVGVLRRFGKQADAKQSLLTAGIFFLMVWLVLDIRWAGNNIRQTMLSLDARLSKTEQQRMAIDLDGGIYQYIQRLKSSVLGSQSTRILIIGDDTAIDYLLLRAKYHLLPHSVYVAPQLSTELTPDTLNFVIFFGQPNGITQVPGWNSAWHDALVKIDSDQWGAVYRVK